MIIHFIVPDNTIGLSLTRVAEEENVLTLGTNVFVRGEFESDEVLDVREAKTDPGITPGVMDALWHEALESVEGEEVPDGSTDPETPDV